MHISKKNKKKQKKQQQKTQLYSTPYILTYYYNEPISYSPPSSHKLFPIRFQSID